MPVFCTLNVSPLCTLRLQGFTWSHPAGSIDFVVPKGSGYIAHPAVTDNCIQLGPVSGLPLPWRGSRASTHKGMHTRCK